MHTVYIPRQQRLRPMILTEESTAVLSGLPVFPRWQRNADRRLYDAKRWQLEGE